MGATNLTRRNVLGLGGVALASGTPFSTATATESAPESVEPSSATLAATQNPNNSIKSFYLAITEQAFNHTYGDKLSPNNISSFDDVRDVLGGTAETYKNNLLQAADDYVEALDLDNAEDLMKRLTSKPFSNGNAERNLMGAMKSDVGLYEKTLGGNTLRTISEDSTNPFFYAMKTLADEGKISTPEALATIAYVRDITHGEEMAAGQLNYPLHVFHNNLAGRLQPIVDAKTATPSENNPVPALNNPFN